MPRYMKPYNNKQFPYGSCWWRIPQKMQIYSREQLAKWSNHELLLMHYYLTMRLDGYGHLNADQSHFSNCNTFREELHSRNIDAVRNVINNETWYDWGYRTICTIWRPLNENLG